MKKEPIMMDGAKQDCQRLLDLSDQVRELMPGCLMETVMYKVVRYPSFLKKMKAGRVSPQRMKKAEISLTKYLLENGQVK